MNRDFEQVCDRYVDAFIDAIARGHGVCGRELHGIWSAIKRPKKERRRRRPLTTTPPPTPQPMPSALQCLKDEDLRRHCLRSGILPPAHRDDMIRVLCANLRHP